MLTDDANGANTPPRAVMQSIGDIARRDGVSKPTVSIAVKRLAEHHGLTVERDGLGRVSLVNVAQYDLLRGRYGDPSKAQAPTKAQPQAAGHLTDLNSYDEALRQKTWHEAERRRLELAEMKGRLVRVDRLQIGVAACGEAIAQAIDRLPQHANDLAISVAKDGEHGLRTALKKIAAKMRDDVATALMAVAADAPLADPATDDDGAGGAKGPA